MSHLEKFRFGTFDFEDMDSADSAIRIAPDFVPFATAGTYGSGNSFPGLVSPSTLENDVIFEGLQAQEEVWNYNAETRALLDEICNSVASIVDDIAGDFGDFAADLDEMI